MTLSRKARIRLIFWGAAFLAYVIAFWVVGLASFFILHPSQAAWDTVARQEFIDAPGGGGKLELYIIRSRAAAGFAGRSVPVQAYVLELIPNAGRAEHADIGVDNWAFLPVEYIALNYPGYGASEGPATLENVHRSALAAYDAIAARAEGKPIFVTGMSLGSAAALHVAANRPVAGIILQNPVPLRQLILGRFGWWNLWLAAAPVALDIPRELDALANAKKVTAPAVFLLADLDTLVPPKYQRMVEGAFAGPKQTVTFRGNHNDPLDQTASRAFTQALLGLWQQQVTPLTPSPSTMPDLTATHPPTRPVPHTP